MAGDEPLQAERVAGDGDHRPARLGGDSRGPRRRASANSRARGPPSIAARGRCRRRCADAPPSWLRISKATSLGAARRATGRPRRRRAYRARAPWRALRRPLHGRSRAANAGRVLGPAGPQQSVSRSSRTSSLPLSMPALAPRVTGRRHVRRGRKKKGEGRRPSPSIGSLREPWAAPPGTALPRLSLFRSAPIGMSTQTNLRPSLPSRNATRPAVSANRVWSLPMPTLAPG